MALRDIIKDDKDTVLRKKSREVTVFDEKLGKLLDDMHQTMKVAEGVGLAAPQVGILRRVCIVEVGEVYVEMVNPIIIHKSGSQIGKEGCLSVPGDYCDVKRPNKVIVQYQDRKGDFYTIEAEELLARACCHEIDHLDGILYYDLEYKEQK